MAFWRRTPFSYAGRVAVITGGSRGLGLLLARRLRTEGARVVLLARDKEELARAQHELDYPHGTALAIPCDVGDRSQVQHAIESTIQCFGRIDVLINNAGVIQVGPLAQMTYDDFQRAMNVHFWGTLHCTEAVLPQMKRRRSGRIINIASIGGLVAVPHLAPYAASKFAVVGYSDAIRSELASSGIRVTTVCPGLMRTGSAINAQIKGQHEAEFAWFGVLSSLPLISIAGTRAARHILEAGRRGRPHLTITPHARLMAVMDRLAPNTTARIMALTSSMLPGPAGASGFEARPGSRSRPSRLPSLLTSLGDRAAARNNELLATR